MSNTIDQQATVEGAIRMYVQALLRSNLANEQDRQERIRGYEEKGHQIVDGGQTGVTDDGQATWEITDWRSGSLLASGTGDHHSYDTAAARLDPDNKWIHIDNLDEDSAEVEPAGIPDSLADALQDWLGMASTPDEDVAEVVGWSVEAVARHREEG